MEYGLRGETHRFALLKFIKELQRQGLAPYQLVEGYGQSGEGFLNIHLDVSQTDPQKLRRVRDHIIGSANDFVSA